MQFIDEAKIYIESGKGGDGCVSFRREKYIPRGGPNGGNGGKGGDVIIKACNHLNTLIDFRFKRKFKAPNGAPGKGSNMDGKNGADLILQVPIGTQIFDENEDILIVDINQQDQEFVIAKGGGGGLGNSMFKSSINQAPRRSTKGEEAVNFVSHLRLKLLSDVGLVGLPNAGKSTFISAVTRAKAKIADYPFTTLRPQLGVVYVDNSEFVIADIPGLIEGASQGKGLGHRFLKHIERCKILLHLIDITSDDMIKDYQKIRKELEGYHSSLVDKKELICFTKIDLLSKEELIGKLRILRKYFKSEFLTVSAPIQENTELVLRKLNQVLKNG